MHSTLRQMIGVQCLLVVLFGAGCTREKVADIHACDWLPKEEVREHLQVAFVGSIERTFSPTRHQCVYNDVRGNPIFDLTDDHATVEQFTATIRNVFPTSEQPEIATAIGVGQESALIRFSSSTSAIYFRRGGQGFILQTSYGSRLSSEELKQFAGLLDQRLQSVAK